MLSVFGSALAAATVLPMSSEAVLLLAQHQRPDLLWPLWAVASVGNTLGSVISVVMGRWGRRLLTSAWAWRWLHRLQRLGPPLLVMAWVPVIGDGLCIAAGILRMAWGPVVFWLALGKSLRYLVLMAVSGAVMAV